MKKYSIYLWILVTLFNSSLEAQTHQRGQEPVPVNMTVKEQDKQATISYRFIDNQQVVVDLQDNSFDRLLVVDMRGTVVLKQGVSMGFSRIDVSGLEEGVYLMILRSTLTLKEKSIKFVVRK